MKKIYLALIIAFLFTNFTFGQTLMSDEDHRLMMNEYETNLNTVLTTEMPQGVTIDQYKKKIVTGELTLSSTAQTNITNYATPLLTYGSDFATAKGLTAITDAYKYFYSSFSPSTMVENGKLVESTTTAGITATEMWTCALESFSTDDCGLSALVSDKSNLNTLATASVGKLTSVTALGNMGVLVMLNGFSDCTVIISVANYYNLTCKFIEVNYDKIEQSQDFNEQPLQGELLVNWLNDRNYNQVELINRISPNYYYNVEKLHNIANFEKTYYNLESALETPVYKNFIILLSKNNQYTPPSTYPCNYKGIRQCAIDRIHSLGYFDMTLCVIEGLLCVYENYASCAVDNCFPRRKPNY